MTQTTLYYREGSSDKIYQAFIETTATGCHVRFAYGRRGSTLTTGTKNPQPVTLDKAVDIFDKLVRSKLAKGYCYGEDGAGYLHRVAGLLRWIASRDGFQTVRTTTDTTGKQAMFHSLRMEGREGAVFKDLNASAVGGRPASGGSQLKFKFVESASFIVGAVHPTKRSIALELLDDNGKPIPAGNVTIPPSQDIPAPGTNIEARYLYAFEESGAIYQPVYLGVRNDIDRSECTTSQLKFKRPSPPEAA